MKVVKVVCGVIWKGDKVFIARRKPEKTLGGFWEFPGGKIEEGEQPEKALVRELEEELGMNVTINKFIGQSMYQYENVIIDLIAYECKYLNATFILTDHDECEFINLEELQYFRFTPADVFLINKITNKING